MDDDSQSDTPRGLISKLIEAQDVSKSVLRPRQKKNPTLTSSSKRSDRTRKRNATFTEDRDTPRSIISDVISVSMTEMPVTRAASHIKARTPIGKPMPRAVERLRSTGKKRKSLSRRHSSPKQEPTPRTAIKDFLDAVSEETPMAPPATRRSSTRTPDLPDVEEPQRKRLRSSTGAEESSVFAEDIEEQPRPQRKERLQTSVDSFALGVLQRDRARASSSSRTEEDSWDDPSLPRVPKRKRQIKTAGFEAFSQGVLMREEGDPESTTMLESIVEETGHTEEDEEEEEVDEEEKEDNTEEGGNDDEEEVEPRSNRTEMRTDDQIEDEYDNDENNDDAENDDVEEEEEGTEEGGVEFNNEDRTEARADNDMNSEDAENDDAEEEEEGAEEGEIELSNEDRVEERDDINDEDEEEAVMEQDTGGDEGEEYEEVNNEAVPHTIEEGQEEKDSVSDEEEEEKGAEADDEEETTADEEAPPSGKEDEQVNVQGVEKLRRRQSSIKEFIKNRTVIEESMQPGTITKSRGGTPGSARRSLSLSSRKLSVGVEDEDASTMEGGSASKSIRGGTPGSTRRGLSLSSRKLPVGVEDEEASTMDGGSASKSIRGGTPGSTRRGLSLSSRKLPVGVEDEEASTMEGGSASKSTRGGSTRRGMSLSKSKVSVQEGTQDDMPQDQDQENSDVEDGEENYMQHNDEEYEEVDDNIRNDDDDDEEVDVPEGAYDEVEEEGGDSGREEEEEEEGENDEGLENSVQSIRNRATLKTPLLPPEKKTKTPVLKTPHFSRAKLAPLQVKAIPVAAKKTQKKQTERVKPLRLPTSLTKSIFSHFSTRRLTREGLRTLEEISDEYWKNVSGDLAAFAKHASRKTISPEDVELLMKRQGLVTDICSMHTLVEKYLPMEYRQQIIPIARSGNRLEPKK